MRKIIFIITLIVLFILSGLIFWAALSPRTFSASFPRSFPRSFPVHPSPNNPATQVNIITTKGRELSLTTPSKSTSSAHRKLTIKENTWEVEIALSDAQRVNGLSNRQVLDKQKGMLFTFDKFDYHPIWMKGMLIPLDIIFFDNNWQIVLIEKNLQPSSFPKTFGSNIKSRYVFEINAGEADFFGLAVGNHGIFL